MDEMSNGVTRSVMCDLLHRVRGHLGHDGRKCICMEKEAGAPAVETEAIDFIKDAVREKIEGKPAVDLRDVAARVATRFTERERVTAVRAVRAILPELGLKEALDFVKEAQNAGKQEQLEKLKTRAKAAAGDLFTFAEKPGLSDVYEAIDNVKL